MATYPGGVKAWTPRRNQIDDVDAADFNQLADEVTAIQTMLGANPNRDLSLNGKRVTWASVDERIASVTRGTQNPFVHLESANEPIANKTTTTINFNASNAVNDPDGLFDGTGFTIPRTGYWMIVGDLRWPANYAGYRYAGLYGGTTEIAGDARTADLPGAVTQVLRQNFAWAGQISAGVKVTMRAYQNSGVTLATSGVSLAGAFLRDSV